ncbi:MAG: hypothetical protein H7240_06090 [Glaciimonas sp.]|nr:hypothetical protein [Glaciimonas sp.]
MNMETAQMSALQTYECLHVFAGASRKGASFKGWGGPVIEWPSKKAPEVEFGTWKCDAGNPYNGGVVRFQCQPFTLLMYGANSKDMRSKDKTTHFGFAGLAPQGRLGIARLPEGCDAREIFINGGWTPPCLNELTSSMLSLMQMSNLTFSQLAEQITCTKKEICDGYGISQSLFGETLDSWPMLEAIQSALNVADTKLKLLRDQSKADRYQQTLEAVRLSIATLQANGKEITPSAIAVFLLNEPNETAHVVKEKIRGLKRILGNDYHQMLG